MLILSLFPSLLSILSILSILPILPILHSIVPCSLLFRRRFHYSTSLLVSVVIIYIMISNISMSVSAAAAGADTLSTSSCNNSNSNNNNSNNNSENVCDTTEMAAGGVQAANDINSTISNESIPNAEAEKKTEKSEALDSSSGALVVFSYSSPFTDKIRSESRFFTFFGQSVRMKQKWEPGGKGGSNIGFGCSVYDASFVLSEYLERKKDDLLQGQTVAELGSGPGLISVVTSLGGAAMALSTDGDEISVSLAQENLELNCPGLSNFKTSRLLWGNEEDISRAISLNGGSKYDLVVASDVAALPYEAFYEQLAETLLRLCKPTGRLVLTYQRRHSTENRFFDLLAERFEFKRLSRSEIHADFRHLPIFLITGTPKKQQDSLENSAGVYK